MIPRKCWHLAKPAGLMYSCGMVGMRIRKKTVVARTVLGASSALALLGACSSGSSGGGGVTTPTTVTVPTTSSVPPPRGAVPAPAAPAPAQPVAVFDTVEYRTNAKLDLVDATAAYSRGYTGKGVTLAILDTGLDIDSAEFAGRLAAGSGNFLPGGVFKDVDGHGTAVASVILGAKNDQGTHGVAYDATLFSGRILSNFLRARTTNPTQAEVQQENVDFYAGFANGLNAARLSGAQAVNLSIGFSSVTVSNPGAPPPPNAPLNAAVTQYDAALTAALRDGVVFVIAAGNDGGAQPNSFPRQILSAATLRTGEAPVLIVGALNEDGQTLASFSDKAGTGLAANYYITAPGVRIRAPDNTGVLFNFSGTSLAAPFVTGALGIVLQAFPNLTAPRAADLLLRTATDLGAPGTDPIYGRGALNLARAFQPQGAQRVATAGGTVDLTTASGGLFVGTAVGSAPALKSALSSVAFLDDYDRVFTANLSGEVLAAPASRTLQAATQARPIVQSGFQFGGVSVVSRAERPFAAFAPGTDTPTYSNLQTLVQAQISPRVTAWSALGGTSNRLLDGTGLVTQSEGHLFAAGPDALSGGVRFAPGDWQINSRWARGQQSDGLASSQAQQVQTLELGVGQATPDMQWAASVRLATSRATTADPTRRNLLFAPDQQSQTLSASLSAVRQLGPVRLSGTLELGQTRGRTAADSLVTRISPTLTSAFAVQAAWDVSPASTLVFGVAQPLRVERGSLALSLPTGYDYVAGAPVLRQQDINLAPTAREIDVELGYHLQWRDSFSLRTSLYNRFSAGHSATGNDVGVALSLTTPF